MRLRRSSERTAAPERWTQTRPPTCAARSNGPTEPSRGGEGAVAPAGLSGWLSLIRYCRCSATRCVCSREGGPSGEIRQAAHDDRGRGPAGQGARAGRQGSGGRAGRPGRAAGPTVSALDAVMGRDRVAGGGAPGGPARRNRGGGPFGGSFRPGLQGAASSGPASGRPGASRRSARRAAISAASPRMSPRYSRPSRRSCGSPSRRRCSARPITST